MAFPPAISLSVPLAQFILPGMSLHDFNNWHYTTLVFADNLMLLSQTNKVEKMRNEIAEQQSADVIILMILLAMNYNTLLLPMPSGHCT